jgi:LCP family protein required for cell wall assembly
MTYGGENLRSRGSGPQGRPVPHAGAWAATAVSCLLVAAVLTGYAAYRAVFGKIHQVPVTDLGKRPPKLNDSLNILVIGSDTRKGQNARFGARIGGQRSDTVLVLHLSPNLRRAVVLSIPRDSVVPVLPCARADGSPGQVGQPGQVEQINATFALGGPACLWKTIEQTTHIRLDHFMELNFTGFEHVVNDLGGVNICLPFAIRDSRSKLHLSSGLHHVWGATALAYWRVRYIGVGSDLERIQRDQFLMASVVQEVKRTDLFGNPVKVYKIVTDMAASLTTDSGLSQANLIWLAHDLQRMKLSAVHFIQVPVVTYPKNPNWVQWAPDARQLFSAIAHDRKLPKQRGSAPREAADRHADADHAASRGSGSGNSQLSRLARHYGGITAGANVCRDSAAFAGPRSLLTPLAGTPSQIIGGRPALVRRQTVRSDIGCLRPGSRRHPSAKPANQARSAVAERSLMTVSTTQSARYQNENGHLRFLRASQTRLRASVRYQNACLALATAGWHIRAAGSYSIR